MANGAATTRLSTFVLVTVVVETMRNPGSVPPWKVGEVTAADVPGTMPSPSRPAISPTGCPTHKDIVRRAATWATTGGVGVGSGARAATETGFQSAGRSVRLRLIELASAASAVAREGVGLTTTVPPDVVGELFLVAK